MNKNQLYHLEPPYGLLNDPNAFIKYKDKYYLFFQWNPLAKSHTHKDWGFFTSTNLIDWDFEGQAIKSNSFYDRDGVYSGTGIVWDDRIYLYYTGNVKPGGKRKSYQNLVTSENGEQFIKEGILLTTPAGFTEHIRDPKVFHYKDDFYMLLAAQEDSGTGAIILYKSANPSDFRFIKILAKTSEFEMVECPDIAFFGDKALINFGLQKRDNATDKSLSALSYYKVATYDFKTDQLSNGDLDENDGFIDYGFDFYVPQTLKLDDGRTVMVAWMSNMTEEQAVLFGRDSYSIHCMTMFRDITLIDNKLYQRPIQEYYNLLGKEVLAQDNQVKFDIRQFRLKINLDHPDHFNLKINDEVLLEYDPDEKKFQFSRINWLTEKEETKELKLEKLESLEIWNDTSSTEVYLNDGEFVLSARINPKKNSCLVEIKTQSNYEIKGNEIKYQS